jgi:hypothetical protein
MSDGTRYLGAWRQLPNELAAARLGAVLRPWLGTPYLAGQQRQRVGVDCVRFVAGVLDELLERRTPIETLPADACMHDPAGALAAMEQFATIFGAEDATDDAVIYPGDAVVTGPEEGGPGHCMLVGHERNVVWHASPPRVARMALGGIYLVGYRVFRVYRLRGGWPP